MFAASRPISGAVSLAPSAQPLTLATPQATPHPQAPVLSVRVVVGTRPEAIRVAAVMGRFGGHLAAARAVSRRARAICAECWGSLRLPWQHEPYRA